MADSDLHCYVVPHLVKERDHIASLERQLKAARKRRKTLVAKLRAGGWSLREVAPYAGISNVAVSQQGRAGDQAEVPRG